MSQGIVHHASPDPLAPGAPIGAAPARPSGHLVALTRRPDLLLKLIVAAATPFVVLLIYVKYLPDYAGCALSTAPPVPLSSYEAYWNELHGIEPFRARFASNYLVYGVAKAIETVIRVPGDVRIHPLRLAAAAVTTVCLWLVTAPVL